jgi:hypothetical protein
MSDFIFDETRKDIMATAQYGDIVFVKSDMLSGFFPSQFKTIPNPIVLITHNSDFQTPERYESYLSDGKIPHWFASNPSVRQHDKLTPIPIGLANARWPHGNIDEFTYAFKHHRKSWSNRTTLLYVNFDTSTNRNQREKALKQVLNFDKHNLQRIETSIELKSYLEQIGNGKFVLSPPGNGLDCHRTWEAQLMGAIPIVVSTTLDPLFSNGAAVIINDLSVLTQDYLLSMNFSSRDDSFSDVLTARYWRKLLMKYRRNPTLSKS